LQDLEDGDKAYQFFKEAYIPNQNPPFNVLAETKGGTNPYFSTGAGRIDPECFKWLLLVLDITADGF